VKVYFVASPRFVLKDTQLFENIFGVLNEKTQLIDDSVLKWIKKGFSYDSCYKTALDKIKKADVVVVEVTGHSMSMGFVIVKAMELNKPVIALYKDKGKQVFLKWMNNNRLIMAPYNKSNMVKVIDNSLKQTAKLIDLRFNFFVNSSILNYLDWVSNHKMIPKSVFLRRLIEKEMKKDKEYGVGN
jgi:2'-deoxynucleoside 5'-phosphate N-hydrolase